VAEAAARRIWQLGDGAELRPLAAADADELHDLIEANRAHLATWLPWADAQTAADTRAFLAEVEGQEASEDGFQAAVLVDGAIAGVCGFVGVDWDNRTTAIGYWLAADRQGRGTMTAAVAALAEHALRAWGLGRVEIRAAAGNGRSRAIPERLGFRAEATFRKAQRVGGRSHDLVVYSLVAGDRLDRDP
jgi:ribosomal-protein-serine acetyltransferase